MRTWITCTSIRSSMGLLRVSVTGHIQRFTGWSKKAFIRRIGPADLRTMLWCWISRDEAKTESATAVRAFGAMPFGYCTKRPTSTRHRPHRHQPGRQSGTKFVGCNNRRALHQAPHINPPPPASPSTRPPALPRQSRTPDTTSAPCASSHRPAAPADHSVRPDRGSMPTRRSFVR